MEVNNTPGEQLKGEKPIREKKERGPRMNRKALKADEKDGEDIFGFDKFTPNLSQRKGKGRKDQEKAKDGAKREWLNDEDFKAMISGFIEKSGGTIPENFMENYGKKVKKSAMAEGV
jgi:hypothetical protein